jgi:hypothetical protein
MGGLRIRERAASEEQHIGENGLLPQELRIDRIGLDRKPYYRIVTATVRL